MTGILWLLLFAIAVAFGWLIWHNVRKWEARRRAEDERFANFMEGTGGASAPTAPAVPAPPSVALPTLPTLPATAPSARTGDELAKQKLLFEAAHKAGEAGEPALAIQLYARLLARYPATTLASPARAAVEAQKKNLLKA